jgi:epoxide hydrolase
VAESAAQRYVVVVFDGVSLGRAAEPTTVPLGVAGFAGDFSGVRRFAERDHKNIAQWVMHPEPGGHYAAHTEPLVYADDLRGFYASLAHG